MGFVFVGEHTLLGRRAAIKTLQPTMSANHEVAERFFNEARAISAISDPGVIQIFDFGYHVDGTAYLVMELLEGETLAARIERLVRLPLGDALRIARQVAGSLAAAHARDIIHRDLKPENVFLVHDSETEGGERAKILDFGICKVGTEPTSLTRSGTMIGTPVYMSPEQCRGAGDIDHRSDIYAFGCLMFHMITGRPPFIGGAPGELIAAHLREEPPPASRYVSGLPVAIDAVLTRCLAKSPADRFASMTELQDVVGELCVQADAPPPARPRGGSHGGADVAGEIVVWPGGDTSSPTHPLWQLVAGSGVAEFDEATVKQRTAVPPVSEFDEATRERRVAKVVVDEAAHERRAAGSGVAEFDESTRERRAAGSLVAEFDESTIKQWAGVPIAEFDEATVKWPRPSTAVAHLLGGRARRAPLARRNLFTPPWAMTAVPSEPLVLEPSARARAVDLEDATLKRPRPATVARLGTTAGRRARARRSRWSALANLLVFGSVLGVLATSLDDDGATAATPVIPAAVAAASPRAAPAGASLPAAPPSLAEPSPPREQDRFGAPPPSEPAAPAATDDRAASPSPAVDPPSAPPAAELSCPARDASRRGKPAMAKPCAQMPRLHPASSRRQRP